jgi:hypothetical protein
VPGPVHSKSTSPFAIQNSSGRQNQLEFLFPNASKKYFYFTLFSLNLANSFFFFFMVVLVFLTVSAKDVIRGLLKTDPDERFTISEVMRSNWVSVC